MMDPRFIEEVDPPKPSASTPVLAAINGHSAVRAGNVLPVAGRRSKFLRVSEFEGKPVPERQELVPGLIPMNTVSMIGGDGGSGKSTLGTQLCASTALDRKWLGLPVRAGKSLYITAEDDLDELHRRLVAIANSEGVGLGEMHGMTVRSLAGEDALLAAPDPITKLLAATELLNEIDILMGQLQPVVVVLDNLADMFGGNEIDRAQARQFVSMLRGPAIRHGAAIVLLAHPSLSGLNSGSGTSGSTAWSNSVRSRLYLERLTQDGYEQNPDARRLVVKKANYARTGTELMMTWRDGVFVTDEPPTGIDRAIHGAKAERVFLKLLTELMAQGRKVSAQPGTTYAPSQFEKMPGSEGVSRTAFTAAMNVLFDKGMLTVRTHGPKSRERSHIAIADATSGGSDDAN